MRVYATPSPATMAAYTSMQRPARRTSRWLSRSKRSVSAAKRRLNQPKKPLRSAWWPLAMGLSSVAHSAGVKVSASRPENRMDTASDSENCR